MRQLLSFSLAAVLAATACAWPPQAAHAQQVDNRVSLNFVDTDIPAVLRALSLFTQRNFLVDPRVKGKITLVSERPVDRNQALSMLTGALRMQGYAIVEVDGVTRVVPEADGKLQGSPVVGGARPAAPVPVEQFAGRGSEIITRVFPLKYENAANLVPVLRPMVAPNNPINAYPGNNTLVITDYADNLERIAQVIARVDVPTSMDTDVVPVQNGIAADIAALATQLMDGQQGNDSGQRIALVADPRSNSVVIRSGSPARTQLARQLIAKLDSQSRGAGNLHVVYLRNALATRMAQILGGLLAGQGQYSPSGSTGTGSTTGAAGGGAATATTTNRSQSAPATQTASYSGSSSMGLGTTEQIQREATSLEPVSYSGNGAVVQADPSTNSLIISAPEPLYRSLREVIDQLDQRRAQVLVESLIVEVSENVSSEFGIQWMTGSSNLSNGSTGFIGGTNLGGSGISVNGATTLDALGSGLSLGVVKGTVDVLGNEIINLGVLARALQATGQANILSTPNLLTLDNEQASIMVGQTVPFITGQYTTSGDSSTNPFQTIEREDVGLKLNIRPQISEGGAVKLDIYQEVSSVDQSTATSTLGVTTNKRAIDTSVLVDDGQIIVLGGLLQDAVTTSNDGVPGLSKIPILGALFRYDARSRTKTNLMVFLRPYVVRNGEQGASLTLDRYDYMRRQQSQARPNEHWLLPDMDAPLLPPAGVQTASRAGTPYDMRPEHLAETMRRDPPRTTETFAVRQMPQAADQADARSIRVNLPRGASIATDIAALYPDTSRNVTTLQLANVETSAQAEQIVQRVRLSGLSAYVMPGPGNQGYLVRADVARDATTVDTTLQLLRELGFRGELVTQP
ncbi:type II secretion system secretin GspD [Bordetella sp. 2513F-2]